MKNFESSLLRERFVIRNMDSKDDKNAVIALSNRMVCSLTDKDDKPIEEFIIRGHNMHSCIRMMARMIQSYMVGGSLLKRIKGYDWKEACEPVINDYERVYNPNRWIAVYHEGNVIFSLGERHPFVDLIEKCDFKNKDSYDNSVLLAEQAFQKTGKNIKIDYDGNVAFVSTLESNTVRLGIILRDATRTTTFNFLISAGKQEKIVNLSKCLSAGAAYLEAMQICFLIGMNMEKLRLGMIDRFSDQDKQTREARLRLSRLGTEISNLETSYTVRYRPERPSFDTMITNSETLAQKILVKEKE